MRLLSCLLTGRASIDTANSKAAIVQRINLPIIIVSCCGIDAEVETP